MLIPNPISGDISLYFHLPFCHKKCDYCHFFVLPNKDEFKIALLEALLKEIEQKKTLFSDKHIRSIYFGGGTPALVGPHFISEILDALSKIISFNDCEITLEVNPENHSLDAFKSFYLAGVNRLSIGVQSFDDEMLKRLGRTHCAKDIDQAIVNAEKAAFENVSIDLMYDLPKQDITDWRNTLDKTVKSSVSHVSLYNLSIEPHTVFYKYKEKIQKQMPKAATSIAMFEEAQKKLKDSQFNHYEISAFCRDGLYSRHNVGYWLQRQHIGFGPSAFSFYDGYRYQNIANLKKYCTKVKHLDDPADFKEKLSQESLLRESLALHMRLIGGFNLKKFEQRFGLIPESLSKTLQKLIHQNLLLKEGEVLKLSNRGVLFHDSIASEII
ncbi:MAG: Heme chaperone HemW [Chlamydiae bacterium]|nr:Heme chaperone HemW [Chlamydiota bacterium]